MCVIVAAAGGLGTRTRTAALLLLLVVGIGFAAVDTSAGGLGFFLGLEAAGEGFVGGGVGLVGVGVVGAEVCAFLRRVGGTIVAGVSGRRRAGWRDDAAFGKVPVGYVLRVDEIAGASGEFLDEVGGLGRERR